MATGLIQRLIDGLDANGWLGRCQAVLSGYLGHADQADVVASTVARVKSLNPGAIYCLDPVFGDNGRAYAKPGVAEAMARRLLPLSDIVTPNAFELSSLASVPIRNAGDAREAATRLGRPLVIATSVPAGNGRIGTVAAARDDAWLASTPLLENPPHGSGDLLAALIVAHRHRPISDALALSVSSVYRILEASVGAKEMQLVARQDELLAQYPIPELSVERIA